MSQKLKQCETRRLPLQTSPSVRLLSSSHTWLKSEWGRRYQQLRPPPVGCDPPLREQQWSSCLQNPSQVVSGTAAKGSELAILATSAWHHNVMLAVGSGRVGVGLMFSKGNLLIFKVVLCQTTERLKDSSGKIRAVCAYFLGNHLKPHLSTSKEESAFKFLTLTGSSGDEKWTFLRHIPTI